MSDTALFASEILKGISTGYMKGMEIQHKKAELKLKKESLLQDKEIKTLRLGNETTKARMNLLEQEDKARARERGLDIEEDVEEGKTKRHGKDIEFKEKKLAAEVAAKTHGCHFIVDKT